MPATIELAGKKLAVRHVQYQTSGDTHALVLFTGNDTCDSTIKTQTSELIVGVIWGKAADNKITLVNIGGRWISGLKHQDVAIAHAAPSAPGAHELHVSAKVEGYALQIDGTVTSVACP